MVVAVCVLSLARLECCAYDAITTITRLSIALIEVDEFSLFFIDATIVHTAK